MSSQNVETFRAAHQAFNSRDFDAVVAKMADGFTYREHPRGITYNGPDEFKEFLTGWVTAFSNAAVTSPTYIDAGDSVIAEFMAHGVNDGPLGPLPKTGREMNVPFCEVVRFNEEGQMVSGALYYDQLSMMTQLGHAQAAGATATD